MDRMNTKAPWLLAVLTWMEMSEVFPSVAFGYKHIRYIGSDSAVHFSRTAHSGEWDAHISIQNREAAHQYHCQGHHFLTAMS